MPVRRITVTERFAESVAFDGAKAVLTLRRAR